jgi:hypothetical protein
MEHITAAANTEIPAYLALLQEGCKVVRQSLGESGELWTAVKGDLRVSAESPVMMLGLFQMRKQRGRNWQAADSEIEAFMRRFYPKEKS